MPTAKEYEIMLALLIAYKGQSGNPAGVDGITDEIREIKKGLHPPGGPG